ncbi:hypothetical protein ACFYUY_01570 [Kitasatospora sp. NPDC004745]|uniref:hypothetical protein n=1 Tax=Kitasatospora sp. NPDC004745 TaxID=3364019 RepID=UPI0036A3CD4D
MTTVRQILIDTIKNGTAEAADAAIDAYRSAIVAENWWRIVGASKARLDEIDEDDLRPSDWERHEQWCAAADVLKASVGGVS